MWHFAQAELEQKIKLVHPKNIMMTIHPPPPPSPTLSQIQTHTNPHLRAPTHTNTCTHASTHTSITKSFMWPFSVSNYPLVPQKLSLSLNDSKATGARERMASVLRGALAVQAKNDKIEWTLDASGADEEGSTYASQ